MQSRQGGSNETGSRMCKTTADRFLHKCVMDEKVGQCGAMWQKWNAMMSLAVNWNNNDSASFLKCFIRETASDVLCGLLPHEQQENSMHQPFGWSNKTHFRAVTDDRFGTQSWLPRTKNWVDGIGALVMEFWNSAEKSKSSRKETCSTRHAKTFDQPKSDPKDGWGQAPALE